MICYMTPGPRACRLPHRGAKWQIAIYPLTPMDAEEMGEWYYACEVTDPDGHRVVMMFQGERSARKAALTGLVLLGTLPG